MAGTAASETILFIAAILVTTAVVGTFSFVVTDLSSDVRVRGEILSDELRTHITIINDPLAMNTSGGNTDIYVKNTGAQALVVEDLTVFIDGVPVAGSDLTANVLESSDDEILRAAEVVWLDISGQTFTNDQDYRVRVVTANGISDTLMFTA